MLAASSRRDRTLPTLIVGTRVSRPWNIETIGESIQHAVDRSPGGCPVAWFLLCDPRAVSEVSVLGVNMTGGCVTSGVRYLDESVTSDTVIAVMGNALLRWARSTMPAAAQERRPAPWVYFLDDDTVMHEDLLSAASMVMRSHSETPVVWLQQVRPDGSVLGVDDIRVGGIDVGQALLNLGKVHHEFTVGGDDYASDGELFTRLHQEFGDRCLEIRKILSIYNALR